MNSRPDASQTSGASRRRSRRATTRDSSPANARTAMGTISRNFSWSEFEESATAKAKGILNVINTFEIRDSVKALVLKVLQPLRDLWGKPIHINSGYRCPQLNAWVGGVAASQHTKGEAADLKTGSTSATYQMMKLVRNTPEIWKEVDQMIGYNDFVHISHRRLGKQRNQLLYNKSYRGKRL